MKIRIEYDSALASSWSYVEVLLPPFPPVKDVQTPILRTWNEEKLPCTHEAIVESRHQAEEIALTEDQVTAISDALRAVRIVPSTGSFYSFDVCDGATTTLTLDAYDSRVELRWSLAPPPEWIAVLELCDQVIEAAGFLGQGGLAGSLKRAQIFAHLILQKQKVARVGSDGHKKAARKRLR